MRVRPGSRRAPGEAGKANQPARERQNKKRPELSSGRLGSPPPELPNHESDHRTQWMGCKCHFGNTCDLSRNRRAMPEVTQGRKCYLPANKREKVSK